MTRLPLRLRKFWRQEADDDVFVIEGHVLSKMCRDTLNFFKDLEVENAFLLLALDEMREFLCNCEDEEFDMDISYYNSVHSTCRKHLSQCNLF